MLAAKQVYIKLKNDTENLYLTTSDDGEAPSITALGDKPQQAPGGNNSTCLKTGA